MRESTPGVRTSQHPTPHDGADLLDASHRNGDVAVSPGRDRHRLSFTTRARKRLHRAHLRALDLLAARRSQHLVDGLELPAEATVADLRDLIEERRGRRVRVLYVDRDYVRDATGKVQAKAAWLEGENEDLLLVDSAAWHGGRDHNLRHEFAHMLLGHACELGVHEHLETLDQETARSILDSRVLPALARGEWTSPMERETELVATMLGRRLCASKTSAPRMTASLADARARYMLGIVEGADSATSAREVGRQ